VRSGKLPPRLAKKLPRCSKVISFHAIVAAFYLESAESRRFRAKSTSQVFDVGRRRPAEGGGSIPRAIDQGSFFNPRHHRPQLGADGFDRMLRELRARRLE
jgi:hypothetical protein